jgi:hypothetical protein
VSQTAWTTGTVVSAFVKQTLTCAPLIEFGQAKG